MRRVIPTARGLGIVCTGAALVVAWSAASAAAGPRADDRTVDPGESIQAAIDAAPDGASIRVRPGVHAESLTITRPVRLLAAPGAVLEPPAAAPDNLCTQDPDTRPGVIPGICVAGEVTDPHAQAPEVADPVDDVTISGLTIRGFNFAALEAYGADHLTLRDLTATDDAGGGVFVAKSRHVLIDRAHVHDTAGRGIDLHEGNADFLVRNATITGNTGEGVFVGPGTRGALWRNHVSDNCVGISAVDLGLPGQSGVSHFTLRNNTVTANNRFCASPGFGAPSQSGTGIALVGVSSSLISGNVIRDNVGSTDGDGTPAQFSLGGLALLDAAPITGGASPHDNLLPQNVVIGNQPLDVLYDGSGSGNMFVRTTCGTAAMPGLCTGHRDGADR